MILELPRLICKILRYYFLIGGDHCFQFLKRLGLLAFEELVLFGSGMLLQDLKVLLFG